MSDCVIPQEAFSRRRTCMLIITHSCNLNCTYCYEAHKSNRTMSFDVAKACIEREIDFVLKSSKYDELEVDFMGGEPFVNFSLIKSVVEWLEKRNMPLPYLTFATTNGTLINGDVKRWVEAHKQVLCLGLSYDGSEEMQAANRGTAPLDIDWFAENWPGQGVRMTVSKETLPRLSEGVRSVWRRGVVCVPALAHGVEWCDDDADVLERELKLLMADCLADRLPVSCLSMLTRSLKAVINEGVVKRFCGTGQGMVAYDVDGMAYPCHMFSPVVLGDVGALDCEHATICKETTLVDPECSGCSLANWCPTCYGFNYRMRGDARLRDHSWCKMVDVIAKISCEFQIRYYFKNKDRISGKDMSQIKAAIRTYRLIKSGCWHVGR